jgi:hypothetical protein
MVLNEITARSWPKGTEARVLSVVEDGEVPLESWRAEGYGVAAARHEMRRRGEQVAALALDPNTRVLHGDEHFIHFIFTRALPQKSIGPYKEFRV